MTSEDRIKRQKELVEVAGRFYDKKGLQPIAGRIIGLLTVMDKEQYTFDEIVEELRVSKSSVSNALKILELSEAIEYITVPGDRKRYFQLKKKDRFSLIDEHYNMLKTSRDYLTNVMAVKANKQSENSVFITSLIEMIDFFLARFNELKKEFINQK
jgi:DNA-binding transcriptional regulator GbsR (MarR family)